MNKKSYHVPVNFNGVVTIDANSQSEADRLVLEQFSKMVSENPMQAEVSEAAIWTNENYANIGNNFFDISHDLANEVSQVDIRLKPCEGQFGSKSLSAKIRISLSEFGPLVSASLPDGKFKLLAFLKIFKGELYMFQADSSLNKFVPTLVPNFVFEGVGTGE